MPFCSNMDGPRDYHTKRNKSDRGRQIPFNIIYMWNLIDTNVLIKQKQTHFKNIFMVTKEKCLERVINLEYGIYTHYYI